MNKESLEQAQTIIIKAINNSKINTIDKIELMINISNFLEEQQYENNIKTLRKIERK